MKSCIKTTFKNVEPKKRKNQKKNKKTKKEKKPKKTKKKEKYVHTVFFLSMK
jgi:hypothetical protein